MRIAARVIKRSFKQDCPYCQTSHVAQSKTVDRVFVAQSVASMGASSAEQFYVSVSRARDSVTVYTDDKSRLSETIQSSGVRMIAHELLKLPSSVNRIDPFESMLRERAEAPVAEPTHPDLKQAKENLGEKIQPKSSPMQKPSPSISLSLSGLDREFQFEG